MVSVASSVNAFNSIFWYYEQILEPGYSSNSNWSPNPPNEERSSQTRDVVRIAPVTPLHATANSQREFGPVESGHSYDHPSRIFHLLSLLARLHAFTHPQQEPAILLRTLSRTIEMIVFERHFSRELGKRRRNEKRFCGRTCNGSTLPVGSFRDVDDNDGSGRGRHSSSRGGGTSRACLR
ncbi:hypothetical protein HZH68_004227 [Vespula germanica]|uniref:Uncharacterized protein n=2 Tax=Vespula TaxID=7451 RepID=A0A834KTH1_VESGE|nr:hypothetical protein HZH68_004227 [Vespula germanica]